MTAPQLQVRQADAAHWQVYRAARPAALAEAPYAFMSTLEREPGYPDEIWRDRLAAGPAASFLGWLGEDAVAMATVKPDNPGDEYAVPGAWQLVRPDEPDHWELQLSRTPAGG